MLEERQVIKVRRYKIGYMVKEEKVLTHFEDKPPDDFMILKSAYTLNDEHIGDPRIANILYRKYGIKPELADKTHNICSIGFSSKDNKWYGWSHRAIHGFSIGDIVSDGDCTNSSGYIASYLQEHPEKDKSLPVGFIAKTLGDCKKMAIAFAESVS